MATAPAAPLLHPRRATSADRGAPRGSTPRANEIIPNASWLLATAPWPCRCLRRLSQYKAYDGFRTVVRSDARKEFVLSCLVTIPHPFAVGGFVDSLLTVSDLMSSNRPTSLRSGPIPPDSHDADDELRSCTGCGAASPQTQTAHTLISSKHGWRLEMKRGSNGRAALVWRCPACWERHKQQREA